MGRPARRHRRLNRPAAKRGLRPCRTTGCAQQAGIAGSREALVAIVRYIVDDVDRSLTFLETLGFTLVDRMGPPFAIMERDGLELWVSGPGTSARRALADGSSSPARGVESPRDRGRRPRRDGGPTHRDWGAPAEQADLGPRWSAGVGRGPQRQPHRVVRVALTLLTRCGAMGGIPIANGRHPLALPRSGMPPAPHQWPSLCAARDSDGCQAVTPATAPSVTAPSTAGFSSVSPPRRSRTRSRVRSTMS